MSGFSFTMPPALAGDANEVDASGEGLQNWFSVAGGIALVGGAVGVGLYAKNRVAEAAGADADSQVSLSLN